MTDYKQLITRMADELDHYRQLLMDDRSEVHALATEARAALAEPEPEEPTDEEITNAFDEWWHKEGLALAPDASEQVRSATEIAWRNGAYIRNLPPPF